jgi:hypothetical protein
MKDFTIKLVIDEKEPDNERAIRKVFSHICELNIKVLSASIGNLFLITKRMM